MGCCRVVNVGSPAPRTDPLPQPRSCNPLWAGVIATAIGGLAAYGASCLGFNVKKAVDQVGFPVFAGVYLIGLCCIGRRNRPVETPPEQEHSQYTAMAIPDTHSAVGDFDARGRALSGPAPLETSPGSPPAV